MKQEQNDATDSLFSGDYDVLKLTKMRLSAWFAAVFSCTTAFVKATSLDSAHGVYSGSQTPSSLPWNTYNYCNAPHVNTAHYSVPTNTSKAQLVYMNVMVRHHKRTPDNLYPTENELNPPNGWICTDFLESTYGSLQGNNGQSAHIFHETVISPTHPFLSQMWNGSCDEGQLTAEGLQDAIAHGKDFASVYIDKLGFLKNVNKDDIWVRTSTEDRTYQVAGGMLYGMDHSVDGQVFKVHNQPATIDSLVPSYSCPNADAIRAQYQSVPAWNDHLEQNADLQNRLVNTLGTGGLSAWSSWYDHYFDTFTSRTCHGHPLPCNSTGACVATEDAVKVFAIGDFEYNYIWKAAQNASIYNSLTFGVMFQELSENFVAFKNDQENFKLRLYVAHDGSMIRLASGLGIQGPLRWPALGSEFIFEVWKTQEQSLFVRVLHEGTPAVGLEWLPLDSFITLLQSSVPNDIFNQCLS
ncbi:phosphoglycerate mutase-like protein [Ramaria rubella]|nr:phosphoglycerate mutase-like protein [Ramaria rubella]